MTLSQVATQRMMNQQIARSACTNPQDVVKHMVAMQAQEYAWAKWAIALRLPGSTEIDIEKSFNEGLILRTHLLRPTWHFVSPADIRWLLKLTAPRVEAINAYMYRQLELDAKVFKKSHDIIIKELEGGKHLTRKTLNEVLQKKKVKADGLRLGYLLMKAELEGILCSGPRVGKQFTYALLEERAPKFPSLGKDEGLAELTTRYFQSRSPASLKDFSIWSGLSMTDVKRGLHIAGGNFKQVMIEGKLYFYCPPMHGELKGNAQTTFLLPDYDEYGMSYSDRSALFNKEEVTLAKRGGNPLFSHMIIIDGTIKGNWDKVVTNKKTEIKTTFYKAINKRQTKEVAKAINNYLRFLSS